MERQSADARTNMETGAELSYGRAAKSAGTEETALIRLEQSEIDAITRSVPGGAQNVQDIYPLTPLQEGMLFHYLLDEKSDSYVLSTMFELQSRMDLDVLIDALQSVIDRHDVLRSAIVWEDVPRPLQVVYRAAALPVEEFRLSCDRDVPEQLEERGLLGLQGWNLGQAPLVRLRVAQGPSDPRWYALLQVHHIVCDFGSLKILAEETMAHLTGRAQALPTREVYRTHVAQVLSQSATNDPEAYFRRKLSDVHEPTIPFGLGDAQRDGSLIKEAREKLDPELARVIRANARRLGVSSARLFHAAWALVVALSSGRDDVVFGTVLLARSQRGAGERRVLGISVNTLPLRLRLTGITVKELVEHTHSELTELLQYEQASLAVAQRCSGIDGSGPLFTALLNYRHSISTPEAMWSGAAGLKVLAEYEARTNYPIALTVDDLGDGFLLTAHTESRVDPSRITGYTARAMRSLLLALDQSPDSLALAVDILPEHERQLVVELFNSSTAEYACDKLVHELFEEQAKRTPAVVAIEHDGQSLTYAEANRKANQLARYLRNEGVGPGHCVGICTDRSLEMIVGLLGVLKSGAAYVPLDPSYPEDRLQYMVQDARPKLVLSKEDLKAFVPRGSGDIIALDTKLKCISGHVDENLPPAELRLTPESLVYVIYTSGSTGRPKGTAMPHRSMVNLIEWHRRDLCAGNGRRVLQFAALSFDVAFQEVFSTLCTGGTLVLLDEWVRRDASALIRLLSKRSIERLFLPPLMLQSLAECSKTTGEKPGTLVDVITAGEQLRVSSDISEFFESINTCRLHNHYGPTETHVVTAFTLSGNPSGWPILPPIGRPVSNTQIYVLNQQRQPVPIGVPGEIYIGGAGVAQGYLGLPELTNQRFIVDPFRKGAAGRLYRTGDVGLWKEDGFLEYLGRNDDQVKIRGYRVELGEVEAQLARHEKVKDAAVAARENGAGSKLLVAYVTHYDGSAPSVDELRAHLAAVLPEHMVPSAFVILEKFPVSPNGKLDRRALPAPDLTAYATCQYEEPKGKVEEALAQIWRDLLRVERVGRHDNFFRLGGHSLLLVQMLERLRRLGLHAKVRSIYERSTLADLAAALAEGSSPQREVPPNLIPPGCARITPEMLPLVMLDAEQIEWITQTVQGGAPNIEDIYPLAPLQEGILFHHLLSEHGPDTYELRFLLALASRERLSKFVGALQQVVNRHEVLRSAVLWERLPRPMQVVHRNVTLPVEELHLDWERDPIEQLKEHMAESLNLDLRRAPMLRLQVATNARSTEGYALLRMHHLLCDHESLETMFAEAMAYVDGTEDDLPAPAAYRSHVAQVLAQDGRSDVEAFFRRKLGQIDEPTAPFGLLDNYGDASRIEEAREAIDPELAQRLRAQARRMDVSAATVFHAAWALVIARTTGRDEVVFGSLLLGRLQGDAGAKRTLGMFINTLPVYLRLQAVTAKGLVEQTQRELVELLSHEQASLAIAQRCSGIVGSAPLFTALLNYRHSTVDFGSGRADVAGLRVLALVDRTNYPVTVSVDDFGEEFTLTALTDRRIDPRRVNSYLHTAVRSLVEALERNQRVPALSLAVLTEGEREQIRNSFNSTRAPYPSDKLIHQLFEEQVGRTPTAIALVYEQQSLTYAELNGRANQLARHLMAKGVRPDELVGLCAHRSIEMVVGLIGILKAGAAYVPLDPTYPTDRLDYMLRNASPKLILTQEELEPLLPSTQAETISLDKDWSEIVRQSARDPDSASLGLHPRNLAYAIYTSGSTGMPKGAMNEHRAVVNRLHWMQRQYDFNEQDRVLQKTPFSFDVSVWEFFLTLLSGARLVIARPEGHKDPHYLAEVIEAAGVTRLHFVPSMLRSFLDELQTGRCLSLKQAVCSGEELSPGLQRKCRELLPHVRLSNLYGPTEAAVDVTAWECGPEEGACIPIGTPISNVTIHVLNGSMQINPVGVAGEIYIGGVGVGRGYIGRPELTAMRFIADPYGADTQERLYRTGDLGRWRPDGAIEYLGRNDSQVKLRGFRIELGEIEAQLARHPKVKAVAVAMREDVAGEKRLVAYVTCIDHTGPIVEELRAHLKSTLPEYMVPSAFVVLDRLPSTASGKLDRRALPAPELESYTQQKYEMPEGKVEETLAEVWRTLLGVSRVGRRDNFFELGGHSLLATRLISRIREVLHTEIPIRALFESPTVSQLAANIHAEAAKQASQDDVWMRDVSGTLAREINEMNDEEVLSQIAEFGKRMEHSTRGG